ncbi:hypothetical protein E2C01_079063 [Portunus trituberculatus]|uniref:Uncharacterized protein n=1 Tax=Portunus trituberculatus TaxID=210409 RepID=A0A5B7IRS9_PORTR|nr:hypothetical protein [Portunus trituberculatus]
MELAEEDVLTLVSDREEELDGISITDVLTKNAHPPSRTLIHHCDRNIHALRFIYVY